MFWERGGEGFLNRDGQRSTQAVHQSFVTIDAANSGVVGSCDGRLGKDGVIGRTNTLSNSNVVHVRLRIQLLA